MKVTFRDIKGSYCKSQCGYYEMSIKEGSYVITPIKRESKFKFIWGGDDQDPLLRCDNLESYEGIKP